MDIDQLIKELEKARAAGSKRVFLNDLTSSRTLDLVNVEIDTDGDTILFGD